MMSQPYFKLIAKHRNNKYDKQHSGNNMHNNEAHLEYINLAKQCFIAHEY